MKQLLLCFSSSVFPLRLLFWLVLKLIFTRDLKLQMQQSSGALEDGELIVIGEHRGGLVADGQ